jgi:GntR family transcriptional regulator, transcriptional repressor for pyruvate dehydrogenase complex
MELDAINVEKRFEALAARLREQILNGAISPGEILPNERALVDISGLSRGSVREALRVLEAQGLVATSVGRNNGRRAIRPSAALVHNSLSFFIRGQQVAFEKLMETIETLEPSLAGLAALHHTEEDIAALQENLEKLRATTGAKKFLAANSAWHSAIAHASHNPVLIAVYDGLSPGLLDPHVAGFASKEVRTAVVRASLRIEEAIIARDAETARSRMQKHVQAYRRLVEPVAPKTVTL